MSQPIINSGRLAVDMADFTGGANSALPPQVIPENQYFWGENIVNRGNIVQTRPGLELIDPVDINGNKLPDGNAQGFTLFQHTDLSYYMVWAIDGLIYQSKEPFETYQRIPNLEFDDEAPMINFQATKRGAKYDSDGNLQLIPPYNVLIIQDGRTRAGFWDGGNSGHLNPDASARQTPSGLWMAWSGSRLWVAKDHRVYASDILDPLSFTEGQYLAERDGFWFQFPITGMIEAASSEALLVFTDRNTSTLQSYIRDRTQWQNTPNFQKEILPGIGCSAGRSLINWYGYTWWWSSDGLTNLDSALNTYRTGRIAYRDNEMMRSKSNLSPVTSYACSGSFENYLLLSLPSADLFRNRHTWVLDASVASLLNSAAPPSWNGIWTGIRPVQWSSAEINGKKRIFCLSHDVSIYNGTRNHIWEAFDGRRLDNDGPVSCSFETRCSLQDGDFRQFKFAEIDIAELYGEAELQVYFGGIKGPWFKILDTTLQAEKGSINSILQSEIDDESDIQAFKPQSRVIRTQEVSGGSFDREGDVCGIESNRTGNLDKGFMLRLDWTGRMGISRIRFYTDPESTSANGRCATSESEDHNIVNDKGEGLPYTEPEE